MGRDSPRNRVTGDNLPHTPPSTPAPTNPHPTPTPLLSNRGCYWERMPPSPTRSPSPLPPLPLPSPQPPLPLPPLPFFFFPCGGRRFGAPAVASPGAGTRRQCRRQPPASRGGSGVGPSLRRCPPLLPPPPPSLHFSTSPGSPSISFSLRVSTRGVLQRRDSRTEGAAVGVTHSYERGGAGWGGDGGGGGRSRLLHQAVAAAASHARERLAFLLPAAWNRGRIPPAGACLVSILLPRTIRWRGGEGRPSGQAGGRADGVGGGWSILRVIRWGRRHPGGSQGACPCGGRVVHALAFLMMQEAGQRGQLMPCIGLAAERLRSPHRRQH